ncbi:histidine utilization repressor [Caulobacter vibrioides]|uniref:histidine utilization repressor n=1 Tax=Caulobacter vibrioides TaxID=155892 RepID=UPI000BB4798B|nr:histidine utilization repressor [Caulobacter vibrioides]ATC24405.1 histidine utilization repressor [Caulobacter vibrioides]
MAAPDSAPALGPPGESLHGRIKADIADKIVSGAWPPGHRIPAEHELMRRYGCSRMTVSKALSKLVDGGLIIRRKRMGSFVSRPRIHSAVLNIPDIQAEVRARGQTYAYRLLSRRTRPVTRRQALEFDLPETCEVLLLRCLHSANERPFALEERLISLDAVPEAQGVEFSLMPPGTWLLRTVPWTEAEHRISAVRPTKAVAQALETDQAGACLRLDRRTWRLGAGVTHVSLLFPGDAFDLVARFTPTAPLP